VNTTLLLPVSVAVVGAAVAVNHVHQTAGGSPGRLLEAMFFLLSGILLALALAFLTHVHREHRFAVERKWGSIGNSSDGWTLTPAMCTAMALIVTLLAVVALGYEAANQGRKPEEAPTAVSRSQKDTWTGTSSPRGGPSQSGGRPLAETPAAVEAGR
jgi:hypothetical protein